MILSSQDNANSTLLPSFQPLNTPETCPELPKSIKPWFYKPRKCRFGLEDLSNRKCKYNSHHWTQLQNQKYIGFLKTFLGLVKGNYVQKRRFHLNRMLSKFIGTRSPIQCRSHHQKMIQSFKTPESIISHFQDQILKAEEEKLKVEIKHEGLTSQLPTQSNSPLVQSIPKISKQLHSRPIMETLVKQAEEDHCLWNVLTFPEVDHDYWND